MIFLYVLAFLVAIVLGCILLWAILAFRVHRKLSHLPGPPLDSFFLGHLPGIAKYLDNGKFLSKYLDDCHKKYGFTFRIFFAIEPIVVTCDPRTSRDIKIRYPKSRSFMQKYVANFCGIRFAGHGLFSVVNAKEHRERRLFLNPAFHKTALLSLMTQFNSSTTTLISKLNEMCASSPDGAAVVNIADLLAKTTLDVIAKVAFGLDLNSVHDTNSKFTKTITSLFKVWIESVMDPFMQYKPWRSKEVLQAHGYIRFLRDYAQDVITKRKATMQAGKKETGDDILSMIIKFQDENSDYTIEEQVDDFLTLFLAGQETTATNLTSTLMFLDRNREWKQLASQEAEQVLGLKDNVDYSDLTHLSVASNCLKESLRLAPPAASLGSEPEEGFVIPGDKMWDDADAIRVFDSPSADRQVGKTIPSGNRTFLSVYTMHRHPLFWSNADQFKPDRWAANTKETSVPFTYLPFSLGSRNCIGQVFAQMEAKIILCRFLRAFDYESLDGEQPDEWNENLTLHLRRGLTIRLRSKE